MRKQSPTGGGIGNVSDRELRQMLSDSELRQMRKQSPTGGGIGNVSDRELRQMRSLAEQEMRMLEERFPIDRLVDRLRARMPSAGESVASGNRMSKMMAEEARALGLKKGGLAAMPKKGKC
jgi:hypothetical protein